MTMASVGSAVQAACQKVRDDALARAGANDLTEAMRRLGEPVEASADIEPDAASEGFATTVLLELTAGVGRASTDAALEQLRAASVTVTGSAIVDA